MTSFKQQPVLDDVAYVFFRGPVIYIAHRGNISAFRSTRKAISEFNKYSSFLVCVSRTHYRILEDLYQRHNSGNQTVYVVSPVSFDTVFPDDIYATMLSSWNYPKSIGGPRPIRYEDYYFAHVHKNYSCDGLEKYVYPEFCDHILHPYISFFNVADWEALARIVGLIGDPRWYYDQSESQDKTVYRNVMCGLGIRLEAVFMNLFGSVTTPWDYALAAWFDSRMIPVLGDTRDFFDTTSDQDEMLGSWVMRKLMRHWNGEYGMESATLFYKSTKLFLTFLVDLWLWVESSAEVKGREFPTFPYLLDAERQRLINYLSTVESVLN